MNENDTERDKPNLVTVSPEAAFACSPQALSTYRTGADQ